MECIESVEVVLGEASRLHAICEHGDKDSPEYLHLPALWDVGVPPKFVELFEAIPAFLEASCDVFVMEALVMPSLWVLCLWGDDDTKVFSLMLGLDLLGWGGACEGMRAENSLEVDRVGCIGSEQLTFSHVEFEVVLCSSVLDEMENSLCSGC